MFDRPRGIIQQAYKLKTDFFERFEEYGKGEYEYNARVIQPKGYPKYGTINRYFYRPEPITDFERIEMEGTLSFLEGIDYLHTKPKLPIMSRRMLYVLNSVGEFPHQVIPVSIEDDEVPIYNHETHQRSGKVNDTDYVAVQILKYLDIFDYEQSVYEPDRINPGEIRNIREIILKEPPEGFPPLFRIPEDRLNLYVSPQARAVLEDADITGINFIDLTLNNYLL